MFDAREEIKRFQEMVERADVTTLERLEAMSLTGIASEHGDWSDVAVIVAIELNERQDQE